MIPSAELVEAAVSKAGCSAALAAALGVSQSSVSCWRRGAKEPSSRSLALLLQFIHGEPAPETDHDRRIAGYSRRVDAGLALWSDDDAGPLPAPYLAA